MTNCECDYKSFYSNLFWTKASSISNDFANNKHSPKSLTSDNQLKEARLHHLSKTSIIAMTSEFDTRIIKTFTAYHSIYVKGLGHCIWSAMFFLHDLYCGYFRVFVPHVLPAFFNKIGFFVGLALKKLKLCCHFLSWKSSERRNNLSYISVTYPGSAGW